MEQCGTNGTMLGTSNLLTPANKFARLHHQHHHLHRKLSSKNSHQKKPLKKGQQKNPDCSGSAKTLSG